jgi:photosystem II stability/assembly factor-like uncharacterized protein
MKRLLAAILVTLAFGTAHAQTWTQLSAPASRNLYGCWLDAADPNHGVVAGYYVQAFDLIPFEYTTTDGGGSWSYQNLYYSSMFLAAQAVAFTSSTTGYVVGAGVVKTYDGGLTWNLTSDFSAIGGQLHDVLFPSATHGYAVGESWTGPSPILCTTTNSGGTWACSVVTDPVYQVGSQLTSVARPSDSALYAGAFSGTGGTRNLVRSTDDGATWSASDITVNVNGLSFSSPSTGCAATDTGILRTTDGGVTWAPVLTTTAIVNDVSLEQGLGFAVSEDGSIWSSANDGASWSPMTSPVQGTAALYDVHVASSQLAFASGSAGAVLRYAGPPPALFADGFETGDTSGWSLTQP